ncbi:MAG: hypothetical protein R3F49_00390 [Planctomycetota bacterium]
MSSKAIDQEIQARVAAFAADLSALIRKSTLENLQQVFGVASAAAPAHAAAPAAAATASGTRKTRAKRGSAAAAGSGAMAATISEFVAANPGSRLEQIAKGLNKKSDGLKPVVSALLASGGLRKTGQKRGTQYFTGSGEAPVAASAPAAAPKRRGRPPGKKSAGKKTVSKKKPVTKKKGA